MEDTSHPTLPVTTTTPTGPDIIQMNRHEDNSKVKNTQASKQANPKLQAETVLCQWNNDAQITKGKQNMLMHDH